MDAAAVDAASAAAAAGAGTAWPAPAPMRSSTRLRAGAFIAVQFLGMVMRHRQPVSENKGRFLMARAKYAGFSGRGGGGGLFFKLPGGEHPPTPIHPLPYTHMLQSDFPGHSDGTAYYALGIYDDTAGTFLNATTDPSALDFSETYVSI